MHDEVREYQGEKNNIDNIKQVKINKRNNSFLLKDSERLFSALLLFALYVVASHQ